MDRSRTSEHAGHRAHGLLRAPRRRKLVFEATYSGVPQIVIPCWLDTFDFALPVEYFGVGIYGSKSCPLEIEAGEFLRALKQITDSGDAKVRIMREKAKAMGEFMRREQRQSTSC